jgi:hypothetical protein
MERKLDMLVKAMTTHHISPIQQISQIEVCAICSHSDHTTETCPMSSFTDQEQANYVGQNNYPPKNNPYSNTYNAGWRNHPNFSWSNNQNVQNPQGQQRNFQQGNNYQTPPQVVQPNPEPKKNNLDSVLCQFITSQQQTNTQTNQAIQRLETQMGQLAKELSERKRGEFPSQTLPNPGGHEQLKAVTTLRSGKTIDNKVGTKETIPASPTAATTSKVSEKEKVSAPPFPQRLVKPKKEKQLLCHCLYLLSS